MKNLEELISAVTAALKPSAVAAGEEKRDLMALIKEQKSADAPTESLSDLYVAIQKMESELGFKHGPPLMEKTKARKRRDELAKMLAARTPTLPAAIPVASVTAPAAPAASEMTAEAYLAKSMADRAAFAESGSLPRAEFAKLKPAAQSAFCVAGGKLSDPVVTLPPLAPITGNTASRRQFDALTPAGRMEFVLGGGKITD